MTDADLAAVIRDYVDRQLRQVLIGCICRIERHDLSTMRADVQPLLTFTATGAPAQTTYAMIADIPVLFLHAGGYYIRPEYRRGDLVWVTFATFDISNGLRGRTDPSTASLFSRENAAVVHGIAQTGWSAPGECSKSGLVIGAIDDSQYLRFSSEGIEGKASVFRFEGDVQIRGALSAEGEIEAMTGVPANKVGLSTHTHPTGVGPSGPPTPGT